ncbi:MAG TPA: hypothetical protein VNN77_05890 [candidate division Zixibacteria bacterium]|nr:hypothetical protein [candidate division Zixibacteria bacterium]
MSARVPTAACAGIAQRSNVKKNRQFESFERMAEAAAANLVRAAAGSAFELFSSREFRGPADLERLAPTEQDRIFNELVVSFIVLVVLLLETPDLEVTAELSGFLGTLKGAVPEAHAAYLKSVGVESVHVRDWKKLIRMRYDEYAGGRHDVRAAGMQLEAQRKTLGLDDLSKMQLLVPVHVVAIGCHRHVCRGRTEGRDELLRATFKSLAKFYVELRVGLEGGRIAPTGRALVPSKDCGGAW